MKQTIRNVKKTMEQTLKTLDAHICVGGIGRRPLSKEGRILLKLRHSLSRSTYLLLRLFIERTAFITSYSDEVLHFKGDLIQIKTFIIKTNTLFMQNSFNTKPFIIEK